MQRILFWVGLFLLANWWWRKQSRAALERMRARAGQAPGTVPPGAGGGFARAAPARQLAEPMARCGVCQVYIPVSEAVQVNGQHFCGTEHARAAAKSAS